APRLSLPPDARRTSDVDTVLEHFVERVLSDQDHVNELVARPCDAVAELFDRFDVERHDIGRKDVRRQRLLACQREEGENGEEGVSRRFEFRAITIHTEGPEKISS